MRKIFTGLGLFASGWAILLFGLMFLLALVNQYPVDARFTLVMAAGLLLSIAAFGALARGRREKSAPIVRELIGKYVLVGITFQNKRGEFKRREQFHGKVVAADESSGFVLSLMGVRAGERKTIPITEVFEPAPRGKYSLEDSGEVVVDPDFTCTWRQTQPDA